MTLFRSGLLALVACATGCAVPERAADWQDAVRTDGPRSWQGRAATLPALDSERVAQVGDHVVYEVVQHREGDVARWSFSIELEALPPARLAGDDEMNRTRHGNYFAVGHEGVREFVSYYGDGRVRIAMHDPGVAPVKKSVAAFVLLHTEQADLQKSAEYGVVRLLEVVLQTDFAFERLLEVVRIPSLRALASRLGRIEIEARFPEEGHERVLVDTPVGRVPAVWIPMTLNANGEPALDCRLLVTNKQWPLLLSMGVLCLEACHPDAPERRVTVRLVDAG